MLRWGGERTGFGAGTLETETVTSVPWGTLSRQAGVQIWGSGERLAVRCSVRPQHRGLGQENKETCAWHLHSEVREMKKKSTETEM